MAEESKGKDLYGGATSPEEVFGEIFGVLIIIALLGGFALAFVSFLADKVQFLQGLSFIQSLSDWFFAWLPIFQIIGILLSGIFLILMVHLSRKIAKIHQEEHQALYPTEGVVPDHEDAPVFENHNPRWEQVEKHLATDSPSEWRLAIMEADIMLDDLLDALGYHGESIGEKLKQIERSDFTNLDLAWEAHKVRNRIAHEGGDFILTEREARRIIQMYKQVFEEFKYI